MNATIQVRDVPEETYASLRRQAEEAGQSLQRFMREQLIDLAETRERKAAAIDRIERQLDLRWADPSVEAIVTDLHDGRR